MSRTIAALATAPGISGLAVIRLSGEESFKIIDSCFNGKIKIKDCNSHTIHYGTISYEDVIIDTVTVSVFKSPNSYTGEDVIEVGCHGGNYISNQVLSVLYQLGAEIPDPGEFTKRAFLNGKLDLTQVEAVSDMIHSVSSPGASTAARQLQGKFTDRLSELREHLLETAGLLELELDFSEEDLELIPKDKILKKIDEAIDYCKKLVSSYTGSQILSSGYQVAIVGFPNSGKSTLFNALSGKERAIVSNIEGTTRDYIEELFYIDQIPVKLIDTAGLRESSDIIELQGIKLVESVLERADLIIVLNDISKGVSNSDALLNDLTNKYKNIILIQNKSDLAEGSTNLEISAKNLTGIDELQKLITESANESISYVSDALINQRHKDLLEKAIYSLTIAKDSLQDGMDNEIISIDIRKATKIIGELTGESWNEEVLDKIFSGFCIGK